MRKSCLKQVYETSPKKPGNFNIKLQNSTFTSMIKKKKHILREKNTKKHFSTTKKHHHEKKHKKHFLFFKNTCWEDCSHRCIGYAMKGGGANADTTQSQYKITCHDNRIVDTCLVMCSRLNLWCTWVHLYFYGADFFLKLLLKLLSCWCKCYTRAYKGDSFIM